jgi:uncharacterized protein
MAIGCKTIYVDLDDVLCETARRFLVIVERQFGKKISYEQLTNFDIGTACSLTADERAALYRIVHEPDELMKMAPIDQAIGTLRRWADAGYEIAIVTGRPPSSEDPSRAWLQRYRVPHHSFTIVNKYSRFDTDNTVAITLDELAAREFSWAVEDSLPMAEFIAHRMKIPVALVDCPWNRSLQDHANVGRYSDWTMIAQTMPSIKAR